MSDADDLEGDSPTGAPALRGRLIDVIDRLDRVQDEDSGNPATIYAAGGPDAGPDAAAAVCPYGDDDSGSCPLDPSLDEVLAVWQAQDAIEVWSEWRDGRAPRPQDKYDAVLFYARNDAYLPADDDGGADGR